MKGVHNPFALWRLSVAGAVLFAEAWTVVTLRTMAMSGMRPMSPSEPILMMLEKPPAFLASGLAAYRSAVLGRGTEAIIASSLRPLHKKARANRRRLTTSSPKGRVVSRKRR
jgi:hypothetical protein